MQLVRRKTFRNGTKTITDLGALLDYSFNNKRATTTKLIPTSIHKDTTKI